MNILLVCVLLCAVTIVRMAAPASARTDPCGDFLSDFYTETDSEASKIRFLVARADEIRSTFTDTDNLKDKNYVIIVLHNMKERFQAESIHLVVYKAMAQEVQQELEQGIEGPPGQFFRLFMSLGEIEQAYAEQYVEAMRVYCEDNP